MVSVGSSFADDALFIDCMFTAKRLEYGYAIVVRKLQTEAIAGRLEHLSNRDCITAFGQEFQGSRSSVLLVTNSEDNPSDKSFLDYGELDVPSMDNGMGKDARNDVVGWICSQYDYYNGCRGAKLQNFTDHASTWRISGRLGDHCLRYVPPQHCKLGLSQQLILAFTAFNLAKAIIMVTVVISAKDVPLLTIGDAISSFMQEPDATTKGMCYSPRKTSRRCRQINSGSQKPSRERQGASFWFRATSLKRWIICNTL
jgi:hypothetical protein